MSHQKDHEAHEHLPQEMNFQCLDLMVVLVSTIIPQNTAKSHEATEGEQTFFHVDLLCHQQWRGVLTPGCSHGGTAGSVLGRWGTPEALGQGSWGRHHFSAPLPPCTESVGG